MSITILTKKKRMSITSYHVLSLRRQSNSFFSIMILIFKIESPYFSKLGYNFQGIDYYFYQFYQQGSFRIPIRMISFTKYLAIYYPAIVLHLFLFLYI